MTPFLSRQEPAALSNGVFDLLVIGGGIYGAWTAYDAAARGLRVALIEQGDWGSGTSSASSKLIHGGLRYLETFEFALVRHALTERRVLSRIAPHLVRPLRFALPVYRGGSAGMFKLSAGLSIYDVLAGGGQPVARHRRYGAEEFAARHPFVDRQKLSGGFSYGDCQEDDARLSLSVVAAAQAAGAVCVSRVRALGLRRTAGSLAGADASDVLGGSQFTIQAKITVAAAGPWSRTLIDVQAPSRKLPIKLVKGTHLLMPAIPDCDEAFLLTAPQDGRVFFAIPWYGRTLVGTTETEVASPQDAVATDEDQRYLLEAVRARLPGLGWSDTDVLGRFAGIRTLQAAPAASLNALTREYETLEPEPGLLLPLGGKYTTSRRDAAGIVDLVQQRLGLEPSPCRSGETPLPGAPQGPFAPWLATATAELQAAGLDPEAAHWAALRHGSRSPLLAELCLADPTLAARLDPGAPFVLGEALLAIRDENALDVEDVLRRRMPLSLLVGDSAAAVEKVKGLMEVAPSLVKPSLEY